MFSLSCKNLQCYCHMSGTFLIHEKQFSTIFSLLFSRIYFTAFAILKSKNFFTEPFPNRSWHFHCMLSVIWLHNNHFLQDMYERTFYCVFRPFRHQLFLESSFTSSSFVHNYAVCTSIAISQYSNYLFLQLSIKIVVCDSRSFNLTVAATW